MARLTAEERKNMEPGYCTRCGKWEEYRNSAGECLDCHNAGCFERKKRRKEEIERRKEEGRRFWAERGIKPGDKVYRFVGDMLTGGMFYREKVVGVAKVGAVGAYVSAPHFQRGYLSPHGWRKLEEWEGREGRGHTGAPAGASGRTGKGS